MFQIYHHRSSILYALQGGGARLVPWSLRGHTYIRVAAGSTSQLCVHAGSVYQWCIPKRTAFWGRYEMSFGGYPAHEAPLFGAAVEPGGAPLQLTARRIISCWSLKVLTHLQQIQQVNYSHHFKTYWSEWNRPHRQWSGEAMAIFSFHVQSFGGEKANPEPLTNQNDVQLSIFSHQNFVMSSPSANTEAVEGHSKVLTKFHWDKFKLQDHPVDFKSPIFLFI